MTFARIPAAFAAILVLALAASVASTAQAQASKPKCADCGVIQSMRYVEEKGQGSGVGAVTGGRTGRACGA